MGDYQYSSLNVVEINDFIRKDTKVYNDLKNSLCGKALELETKKLVEDKATIDLITDQLKYEDINYEKMASELENPDLEGQSFFAKLSIKGKNSKALKKLEKEHKNTIMILNNRLKKHKSEYEDNRVRLQHIIDKIEEKGFKWQDVKKLLESKIRQGVFDKNKKPKKEDREEEVEVPIKPKKPKKKRILNGGSFYGDPNYYDVSDLTPEQRREWDEMLKKFNYRKERLKQREIETARMMRMAMMERNQNGMYDNLLFGLSDYSLFNGLFKSMFNPNEINHNESMRRMMRDSGYGLSFIDRHLNGFANEMRGLFNRPDELDAIRSRMNCMCGERYFGNGLGGAHRPGHRGHHPHMPHVRYMDPMDRMLHQIGHEIGEFNGRCCRPPSHRSYLERLGIDDPGIHNFSCNGPRHASRELEGDIANNCLRTLQEKGSEFARSAALEVEKENKLQEQMYMEYSLEKNGPEFHHH